MNDLIYKNDFFYDIESLENVFTCAIYFPIGNKLEFYYIEDGDDPITAKNEFINNLEYAVKEANKNFSEKDTGSINIYNLKEELGYIKFLNYFGISTSQENGADMSEYIENFQPVKDTDRIYDKNIHGKRFGYNSTNYDLTMLAYYFEESCVGLKKESRPTPENTYLSKLVTAKDLRNFNDQLFEEQFKKQMPKRLAARWNSDKRIFEEDYYGNTGWKIRKTWLITGRYIDVARLNDHMRTVGLKRILGMLGFQILESDKLSGTAAHIETVEEMLDLFAYNASDVINLYEGLFLNNVYQSSYKNKTQLLDEYKELIYKQKKGTHKPDINENSIRRDRLCVDSSSAKFIENTLCPYGEGLTDQRFVSFDYPADSVCKRDGIQQFNVLEDTKRWFEANVGVPGTPQHDKFMRIYNFYKEIEGTNFNGSDKYIKDYRTVNNNELPEVKDKRWVKSLMNKYDTNLFYFDANGNETDCFVTFSVGGIHGQEINRQAYNEKYAEYKEKADLLEWVKKQYNGDALAAVNGPVKITLPDGTEERIRAFLKSGSTKKKADWRTIKEPKLFKIDIDGNINLAKEYVYTSIGKANHEDFTSYYPLLLCNLAAFDNKALGEDRYYSIFLDRKDYKQKAKDKSYSEEEREMFNLIQNGKKLLLNSASGAGDASFDSNIRMNNRTISMRIIG